MKFHSIISYLALLLFASLSYAQQDPQFTQYIFNTATINPAYSGTRGVLSVVGLHRSQWIGLPGAPRTQTLSVHSPIGLGRVGLGANVINDEIGPTQETYFNADFSYTIPTSTNGKLSFGLKAGGRLLDLNFNRLTRDETQRDVLLENSVRNQFSPTVGVGVYYRTEKLYFGLSVPNLLETEHFDRSNPNFGADTDFLAKERINYYLIGGYVFRLNDDIDFKPAFFSKLVLGAPLQVDVTANFLFYEKLTLGVAYRVSAAFSGIVAFQVSDSTLIGFSYDRETTELGDTTYNDGSFELTLRFELFKKYNRLITPRFF